MNFKKLIPAKLRRFIKKFNFERKLLEDISKTLPVLVCIDVGASYRVHLNWEIFLSSPLTKWICVEPNSSNLTYLNEWGFPSKLHIVDIGLSDSGGEKTLFVANKDSGSSLLEPLIPPSMLHRISKRVNDYYFPITEKIIKTRTLEDIILEQIKSDIPIFIKLDTEGTELSILKGAEKHLENGNIIGIEIECSFLADPILRGASKFWECCQYLESKGFELVAMNPIMSRSDYSSATSPGGNRYLLECDAVFALKRDLISHHSVENQIAQIGFLFAYQLYEEILSMITNNKEIAHYFNQKSVSVINIKKYLLKRIDNKMWF
jgi:FkbM family methyltransferase